jgi:RHS repeat-associated protein
VVTQKKIWTSEEVALVFGTDAYLDQIADTATTLEITITRNSSYKDRILQIQDDTGNKIVLTYTNSRLSSAILSLYESGGVYNPIQKASYSYTYNPTLSGYNLTGVIFSTDMDGDPSVSAWIENSRGGYTYDYSGRMTLIKTYTMDENLNPLYAEKTQYTYDASGKVSTIETFYDSAQYSDITYTYSLKTTKIRETNDSDKYIIYNFDDFGHTVSMLDSSGTSQSTRYLNLFSAYDEEQEAIYQLIDGTPNYYLNHLKITESSPVKTLLNPVINHGFEYDFGSSGDAWTLYTSDGLASYSLSTAEYVFGNRSGLLSKSSTGTAYISENFLLDGNPYTLSGYVKNDSNSDQVCIDILNESYGGVTTSVPNDGEWHYVEVLFGVSSNDSRVYVQLINNAEGNVYFDNIQVVEGFTDTRKNLVDNPSFEYVNVNTQTLPGWTMSDPTNVNRVNISSSLSEVYGSILGDFGIRILGSATENRNASISLAGIFDIGDSDGLLVVGAWACSNGTPVYESGSNQDSRFFRIRVDGLDSSENLVQSHYLDFDSSVEGWQYLCGEMPVASTEVSFILYLEYKGEGSVLFDGLQIYYEPLNTRYSYSVLGQTTQITGPSQDVSMTYEDGSVSSVPATIVDNVSGAEVDIVSEEGMIESVSANNVSSTPTYNSTGQVTSLTVGDAAGDHFTTSTAYLTLGFSQYVSSTTDEFGEVTQYYSDLLTGLSEAIENARGQDTHYLYDEKGRLIEVRSVEDYTSALSDTDIRVVYQYDDRNRLATIIMGWTGSTSTYFYSLSYDAEGRMYSVSVNDVTLMTYTYADDGTLKTGNIETQTYGNGDAIKFVYDDQDRISDIQFRPSGSSTFVSRFAYSYDQDGRIAIYKAYENGNLITTEYYTFDSSGNLIRITDGEGNKIEYEYDPSGNLIGLHFVLGGSESSAIYFFNQTLSGTSTSLYDYTTITPQSGVTYTKEYNYEAGALRRLESLSLFSGSGNIFEQDFAFLDDTVRITDIRYDILGDGTIQYTYSYLYDELGNIVLVSYYEGTSLKRQNYYEYDAINQLVIEDIYLSTGSCNSFAYEYDLRGNRTACIKYPYGYRTGGVTYDPATLSNTGTISVTPYVNGQIYSDPVIVDLGETLSSPSFTFVDENGYGYSIMPSVGSTNFIDYRKGFYYQNYWAYLYMGNQTINCHFSIIINVGDVETAPGVSIKEYQFEYSEEWLDQLESYDIIIGGLVDSSSEYVYDDQGNPVSITNFQYGGNATLFWDGRQLTEIQWFSSSDVWQKTMSFQYNDQGYRTKKTTVTATGTTTVDYTLSGDKVLRETNGIWEMVYAYDYDGTLIGFNYDENIADSTEGIDYFYLSDQQGDIVAILNASGTAVMKYRYDAFGNRTIASYTSEGYKFMDLNPYTYRGYRYDTDTGLYYLNSRYYDPEIGRFLNSDGLLGETGDILSTNMYAYCANNPVMYLDPSGESFILIILATISIGLLVSAVIISATEIYLNQKSMREIPRLILPDDIDIDNETMLEAYYDQQARYYVEQRYVNFSAMTNSFELGVRIFMRNIPIFGALISRGVKNDIKWINDQAANNESSISCAYDAAYLNVVGSGSYFDYFVERVRYWRNIYDISQN